MSALQDAQAGDVLPELTAPAVSRSTLALYAGASGDHNPLHIDIDYARAQGLEDVIAHGMLAMAYMGRAVTALVPQQAIRSFSARFVGTICVHEQLRVTPVVADRHTEGGEQRLRLTLTARGTDGAPKVTGEAVVAIG